MNTKSFINIFKNHCLNNNFEKNSFQKDLVIRLSKFTSHFNNKSSWLKRFFKSKEKCGYYTYGSVGVGKTMIINLYYEYEKYTLTMLVQLLLQPRLLKEWSL